MTPDEAMAAVGKRAAAMYANGFGEHGRGKVVSYSLVPVLTIESEDGTRFSWRHDLCEPLPDEGTSAETIKEAAEVLLDRLDQRGHLPNGI